MKNSKLSEKHCVPCEGGVQPLSKSTILNYKLKINKAWKVVDGKKLQREFKFKSFVQTMGFVNQVALIAQAEDHHPDMQISYSHVVIELWTHSSQGLTENDFILAAKIDQL
jgi:4a-hydroxytetrahydrobiopterin dehydratase